MIDKNELKQIINRVAETKSFKKPSIDSMKEHCTCEGNIKNFEFHFTYGQWPIQLSYMINDIVYTHQSKDIDDALKWMDRIGV